MSEMGESQRPGDVAPQGEYPAAGAAESAGITPESAMKSIRGSTAPSTPEAALELARVLERLLRVAARDPELRALLRDAARAILAGLDGASPGRDAGEARAAADVRQDVREDVAGDGADRAPGEAAVDPLGAAEAEDAEDGREVESPAPAAQASAEADVEAGIEADADAGADAGAASRGSVSELMAQVLSEREKERLRARERQVEARDADRARPPRPTPAPQAAVPESERESRELARLAADADLKAEAARWVGERQRRLVRGVNFETEIAPGDRDILHKGASAEVFLWMCRRDAPVPADPGDWDVLAGCYDALADALRLNALILQEDALADAQEEAMLLLAEAQSALRVAVDEIDEREDETQREAFGWLRRTTDRNRIYVPRFMRLSDPADPQDLGELRERSAELDDALRQRLEGRRQRRKQWGRLRYHLGRTSDTDPEYAHDDWVKALDAVDRLVDAGVAPSSVELRDALLPYVDEIPDDVEAGKRALLALREVDRFLAAREAEDAAAEAAEAEGEGEDGGPAPSEEERRLRALASGKAMVLIGGIQRPRHKRAIERAFGLSELVWLDGGVDSYTAFEPAIAREDVLAVMLLIRWSSHGYGDVKAYCDAYDKPLVRVPGGYNPRQLAYQVMEQAGERLGGGGGG